MRALDTCVVVRILADPTSSQYPAAVGILDSPFAIPPSVFMETEWVLRSVYSWPRHRIAVALRSLLDLPNSNTSAEGIGWTIERFAEGADYADMMHLCLSAGADRFATLDTRLARHAGAGSPVPVETLA